jgi:hypothetical protein
MSEDKADGLGQPEQPAGTSLLLAQLYREIGLAAIAIELGIDLDEYDAPAADAGAPQRRELAA